MRPDADRSPTDSPTSSRGVLAGRAAIPSTPRSTIFLTALLAVAALYLGRVFFVPLALAGLFAFLLAPIAEFLERRIRVPRVPASILSIAGATCLSAGLAWMVAIQAFSILEQLPTYRDNIQAKFRTFQGIRENIESVSENLDQVRKHLDGTAPPDNVGPEPLPEPKPEETPQRVAIATPPPTLLQTATRYLGPLLGPLSTVGLVLVLTLFMLLGREGLRDRIVRILSRDHATLTNRALDEATRRVSQYLLTTLAVNGVYGIAIGTGLVLLGIPKAFLWGLLATLLRFIPYVGPFVAASLPIVLSLAVFETWSHALSVLALFLVVDATTANFVEPHVYGRRTGLSSLAILLAAFFWVCLWGVPGLFLSVPLTLCLAVAGRYVPEFGFLHLLLSDDPSAVPPTRFYQQLATGRQHRMFDLAIRHREVHGLLSLYDDLVLPVERIVEDAEERGHISSRTRAQMQSDLESLLARLCESSPASAPLVARGRAVCVPVHADADDLVTRALSHVLADAGYRVERLASLEGPTPPVDRDPPDADVLLLVASPRDVKRLGPLLAWLKPPGARARVVAVVWSRARLSEEMATRLEALGADHASATLRGALGFALTL